MARRRLIPRFKCLFILSLSSALAASAADRPDYVPGRLLAGYRQGIRPDLVERVLGAHRAVTRKLVPGLGVRVLDVPEESSAAVMASLQRSGAFRFVERDYYAHIAAVPNDPSFSSEWHLAQIQAPQAWNVNTGAPSVVVAVIDSGADATHPDLASKLLPGWNFLTSTSDTTDGYGHGTAVAGTIAAAANNGIGVAGVTWGSVILPLVVVDASGSAAYSDVASAIQYAADHGARLMNISLGGSAASATLQSAVDYAWSKGAVVFASAMNDGTSTPYYPAACNHVVAVSATDSTDSLASFSNYGNWVSLSAPGTNILTTSMGGSYGYWSGTSFSSPIAAGAAALALAVNPSLTNSALVALLEQNTDDLGAPGYDTQFGFGRVNAYKTVVAAQQSTAPPPAPPPSGFTPIRVNAGGPAYVDSLGQTWSADTGYNAGYGWATVAAVGNTAAPALYQTCRYGSAFTYQFAVPDGTYTVNLKFAEVSRTGAGQRVFNVAINGAAVLSNFDIVAQAGGADIALDKPFPVAVTGGRISIRFTAGSADWPMVNAIEILSGGSSSTSGSPIRVNAGGGAYTDPHGSLWSADTGSTGGYSWSVTHAIANTATPSLYQTCRYGSAFTYQFAMPAGTYTVNLKFAEVSRTGAGQRVFNVAVNGAAVLSNFDIFAQAGGEFIALDKSFPVTVTGGQIAIRFTAGTSDWPMVNAIEIVPAAAPGLRVNAGGASYTDPAGGVWSADSGFSGGSPWSVSHAIANTATPAIYQTCRYGSAFTYRLAVPDGTYTVNLKFAEVSRTGVGQRVFNVTIDGAAALPNFDIFAQAGGEFIAIDKTFTVSVSGGQLVIQFSAVNDWPLVSGIEVISQ